MKKFTFAEAERILNGAEHQAKGKPDELKATVDRVLDHVIERNPNMAKLKASGDLEFDGYADFYSWFYSFLVSDRA
jgi:hypothetical protein